MKPIVLFGTGKIGEVLLYFFRNHSGREVAAVTVDRDYLPEGDWHDLPTVAFDEVEERYAPQDYDMFVALGYQDLNGLRARKYEEARSKGYALPSYVHPDAGLPSDCRYGDNCFIMNSVLVHPHVTLGSNVFVWTGAMIGHHSTVGDHCWLTSCCSVSGGVTLGASCFLAVNATIGHEVTLGSECFVGANALVTRCADDGVAFVSERTKPFRLTSRQFLRMSELAEL